MSAVENTHAGRGDIPVVTDMPWWGTAASIALPTVLIVGLAVASYLQPPRFDAMNNTVSALAATGANDDWIMTATFIAVGAIAIVTALGLRPAAGPGRFVLGAGGFGGMMVAAFPEHLGGSLVHACWAGVGFGGLVLWPLIASRGGPDVPWGLRRATGAAVTGVYCALLIWFLTEELTRGLEIGVAERAAGLSMCLWPLLVAVSCRLSRPVAMAVAEMTGTAGPGAGLSGLGPPERSALEDLCGIVTSATFQSGRRA
ncbi:MAG TPA: DUF998 domain-containing protein [Trebonia sp.]